MFIKNVNKNVADVFVGKGWVKWLRVDRANGTIITGSFTPDSRMMNVLKSKLK